MPEEPPLLIRPTDDLKQLLPICPTSTVALAWSEALARSVVISVGCRRWACPFCGRRRVAALARKVEDAEPNRLVTLTVDPKLWESPRHAYDGTRRALAPFTRAMRRGGEFEYLRVLELTKKGWPHYHLLVRSPYRPYAHVQATWAELTGARVVDIRQVKKRDSVYWYLVKYLAKQHYCDFTERRVSQTSHFFKPKVPYPGLGLIFRERETCTLHTWLRYRGKQELMRPIGAYMWAFEDQGGATSVAPS